MANSEGFTVNQQVEQALDHSRIELGDEFSSFERRGRAMTMKELIDYATEELQQIVQT